MFVAVESELLQHYEKFRSFFRKRSVPGNKEATLFGGLGKMSELLKLERGEGIR